MEKADVKFILLHKKSGKEIEMPVLGICEEYSTIFFATKKGAYNDEYNGIGRLPSYNNYMNDSNKDYDFFVEINGERYLYDGLFFNSDGTESKRQD